MNIMKPILITLLTTLSLTGCSDIFNVTPPVDRIPLPRPTMPTPPKLEEISIRVMGKDALTELLKDVDSGKIPNVVVLSTEDGTKLIKNINELRRVILEQQTVIRAYVIYSEKIEPKSKESK